MAGALGRMVTAASAAIAAVLLSAAQPAAQSATILPSNGECASDSWGAFLSPHSQTFATQPAVELGGGLRIVPVVFGPLVEPFGKVHLFMLTRGDGCILQALSVGSYLPTTMGARARGEIGAEDRVYHTDLYLPDRHITLGFAPTKPGYADALALAREHLR